MAAGDFDTAQLQYPGTNGLYLPSKYSDILLANFFYNSFLQPGVTYTDRYQMGNAGQIFVPRLKPGDVKFTTPCDTFEHKKIGNELLQITLNNTYMSSKQICELQSTVADYSLIGETIRLTAREMAEKWNLSGLAALITEGTGGTAELTKPTDLEGLKKDILSAKTELYKKKRSASVMICSPDFYQMVLQYAGTLFTPGLNDRMLFSGEVGTWLGLRFINSNLLQKDAGTFEYHDYKWQKKTVAGGDVDKIAYILYNPDAFSVLVNFNRSRQIGSPDFMGVYVQSVLNSGFRITDPSSIFIRRYDEAWSE